MNNKTIAIDFDGVIHKSSRGYLDGEIYDEPTESAMWTLNNLSKAGYKLVVLTSRQPEEWPKVSEWLLKHGFPTMEVTNVKPPAMAYIDDRAIRFINWADTVKYFL